MKAIMKEVEEGGGTVVETLNLEGWDDELSERLEALEGGEL